VILKRKYKVGGVWRFCNHSFSNDPYCRAFLPIMPGAQGLISRLKTAQLIAAYYMLKQWANVLSERLLWHYQQPGAVIALRSFTTSFRIMFRIKYLHAYRFPDIPAASLFD